MIASLIENLGVAVRDASIFEEALTHSSYVHEKSGEVEANERLEFLGDAIVGLVVCEELYRKYPERVVGDLAKAKGLVVSEASLADAAAGYDLGRFLRLGKGEKLSGGSKRDSIMADTFEAVVGAIFLDTGYAAVRTFVLASLGEIIDAAVAGKIVRDFKSLLQVYTQQQHNGRPHYKLEKMSGPAHQREYQVTVFVAGDDLGQGTGKTKKAAEQAAARNACTHLKLLKTGHAVRIESAPAEE